MNALKNISECGGRESISWKNDHSIWVLELKFPEVGFKVDSSGSAIFLGLDVVNIIEVNKCEQWFGLASILIH